MSTYPIKILRNAVAVAALLLVTAACGSDSTPAAEADSPTSALTAADPADPASPAETPAPETEAEAEAESSGPTTLRLGYFPNVTHAPALVGIHDGVFASSLGAEVTLEVSPFNAGPEAVEALFAGAIDATFIGPNPAINAFAKSNGEAIRIVAGSTSGGAFLVVAPEIDSPEDLRGTTIATPQLGGTQDVAARRWLLDNGLESDTAGGGDVSIAPQANADTLTAFKDGTIAGAWVPEPWATRLVQEGGGTVLVDERDLWPDGRYVTTHLIVATEFLEEHPDVVRHLLDGLVAAIDAIDADPAAAQASANAEIATVTGKPLPDQVIAAAWENLEFTVDPVASSLQRSAEDAIAVGLLEPVELDGIYDLGILNEVLATHDRPEVTGL